MLKHFILLSCLPIFFLTADPVEETASKFTTGPAPAWVKACDFPHDSVAGPSDVNYLRLLDDNQVNWEEKTHYVHTVVKVLDQTGAEGFTQLPIDFDPAYEKVIVHAIRVLRNGESLDRLEKSRHQLLQREQSLERNLYYGQLSLVYFLNDIRVGDTVEYSYSIVENNPLWASHFTHLIHLQTPNSWKKIYYRILTHPHHSPQIKQFHTSIKPKVTNVSPNLREWTWVALDTPALPQESSVPSWYNPLARLHLSEYKNWHELVQKILPLFSTPADLETHPSSEMLAQVQKWKESTDNVFERAVLALRFVQDEVKYMSLSDGINHWKPTDPYVVFERRFGDSKDKSMLLQALLKRMNISSMPVLVNTQQGKKLPDFLPQPTLFDHVVLRIEINGSHYWVDSTMTHQGGSLLTNFFPDYGWGLVISKETTKLSPIPAEIAKEPIHIRTSIVLTSPESAELKIESTYQDSQAEERRRVVQCIGQKKYSDGCLEFIQKKYKGASLVSPVIIVDNREKNHVTQIESYKIPTRSRLGKKLLKTSSFLLDDYLATGVNLERTSPYALFHPLWIKEHIHIENPFSSWAQDSEEASFANESIQFIYTMKKEGQAADFDFELKHLKDHVPVKLIPDYLNLINEIEPNPSLDLTITVPTPKP